LCALLPARADAAPRKTFPTEVARLVAGGAVDPVTGAADIALYRDVKATAKRLSGTRRVELSGVVATVDDIAARGQLTAGRLAPLRLTLSRNREWWTTRPLLAGGARVTFPGSLLVWQYFRGEGLAIHPLANFGKLNALAKSRRNDVATEQLLDELLALGVPRGGGVAWEYYFDFDGGKPPWVSGLAQGTAVQAIARAAVRLGRLPELLATIRAVMVMFTEAPPTGVRVATPAGAHYAQYSFAPGVRILNGFIQSLVGLYDVGQLTGDPEAQRLFAEGDAEARLEVPQFDTGAWSYYSLGAVAYESSLSYHTLLRDFLANLCDRTQTAVYCTAETHFASYLTVPPALALRTLRVRGGTEGTLRFALSKIARVTVRVTAPDGRPALVTDAGVVGRGTPSVKWAVPRKPGVYAVALSATDLAGNPATVPGTVEVLKPKPKRKRKPAG
jgi:hypothetical protein